MGPLRAKLEGREDVDDDEVASVVFALGAVMGGPGEAWWAANRARDAADERIPSESEFSFRSADAERIMRDELDWQLGAVTTLEGDEPLSAVVPRLRS